MRISTTWCAVRYVHILIECVAGCLAKFICIFHTLFGILEKRCQLLSQSPSLMCNAGSGHSDMSFHTQGCRVTRYLQVCRLSTYQKGKEWFIPETSESMVYCACLSLGCLKWRLFLGGAGLFQVVTRFLRRELLISYSDILNRGFNSLSFCFLSGVSEISERFGFHSLQDVRLCFGKNF